MFPVPKWLEISAHSNFHARTKSSTWSSSRNGVAFSFTPVSLLRVEEGRQWVLRWPGFTFAGCVRGRRATGRGAPSRLHDARVHAWRAVHAATGIACDRFQDKESVLCVGREKFVTHSPFIICRAPLYYRVDTRQDGARLHQDPRKRPPRQWPVGPLRNTCGPSATAV